MRLPEEPSSEVGLAQLLQLVEQTLNFIITSAFLDFILSLSVNTLWH